MTLRNKKGRLDQAMVLLAILVFLIVTITATLVYAMYFHDAHPAEFKSTTVISETIEPGGELEFYLDWCENSLAPREVYRTWTNSEVITMPPLPPHPAPIGCMVSKITWDVPARADPGEYIVKALVVFDVNPLSNRVETFEVGPVTVVEKQEKPCPDDT